MSASGSDANLSDESFAQMYIQIIRNNCPDHIKHIVDSLCPVFQATFDTKSYYPLNQWIKHQFGQRFLDEVQQLIDEGTVPPGHDGFSFTLENIKEIDSIAKDLFSDAATVESLLFDPSQPFGSLLDSTIRRGFRVFMSAAGGHYNLGANIAKHLYEIFSDTFQHLSLQTNVSISVNEIWNALSPIQQNEFRMVINNYCGEDSNELIRGFLEYSPSLQ